MGKNLNNPETLHRWLLTVVLVEIMAGSFTHMHIINLALNKLEDSSPIRKACRMYPKLANYGSVFPDQFYYGDTEEMPEITRFTDWLHKEKNTSFVLALFDQIKSSQKTVDYPKSRELAFSAATLTHIASDIIVHPAVDHWLERYSKELDPRDRHGQPIKTDYYDNYIPHSQCELTHDCYVHRKYRKYSYAYEKTLAKDIEIIVAEAYRRTFPTRAPPTGEEQQLSFKRFRIAIRYLAFCNGRIALPPYFYRIGRNFPFSLRGKRERLFLDGFEEIVAKAADKAAEFLRIIEKYLLDEIDRKEALTTIGEWGLDHGDPLEIAE